MAERLGSFLLPKAESLLASWSVQDRLNGVHILHVFLLGIEGNLNETDVECLIKLLLTAASNEDSKIASTPTSLFFEDLMCTAQRSSSAQLVC